DRWNAFENKLNEYYLKELIKRMELFRDEITFVLNNVDIPGDEPFKFLKRLSAAIYSLQDTTLGYDQTEPISLFLWDVFAGWDRITGFRKDDIVKKMIDAI